MNTSSTALCAVLDLWSHIMIHLTSNLNILLFLTVSLSIKVTLSIDATGIRVKQSQYTQFHNHGFVLPQITRDKHFHLMHSRAFLPWKTEPQQHYTVASPPAWITVTINITDESSHPLAKHMTVTFSRARRLQCPWSFLLLVKTYLCDRDQTRRCLHQMRVYWSIYGRLRRPS